MGVHKLKLFMGWRTQKGSWVCKGYADVKEVENCYTLWYIQNYSLTVLLFIEIKTFQS